MKFCFHLLAIKESIDTINYYEIFSPDFGIELILSFGYSMNGRKIYIFYNLKFKEM